MKNERSAKLFLILLFCTAYIFSFTHFGVSAYDSIMNKGDTFGEGTKIGPVPIEGMTYDEAFAKVVEETENWLGQTTITVHFREKSAPFDVGNFAFDVESSFYELKDGQENPLIVRLRGMDDYLASYSEKLNANDVNKEKFQQELLAAAVQLQTGDHSFRLENFLLTGEGEPVTIHKHSVALGESKEDVDWLINEFGQEIVLEEQSQFSLLNYLETFNLDGISSRALSILGTAIYEAVLPTNFTIIERHISGELPSYASLGFEAAVDPRQNFDLVIANPNDFAYSLQFQVTNNDLTVSLIGPSLLYKYEIETEDEETFEQKTVKQYDPKLQPGQWKVQDSGRPGKLIKVFRLVFDEAGIRLNKEEISEDFYPPVHRVEIHGLIPAPEPEEELNEGDLPPNQDGIENGDQTGTGDGNGQGAGGGTSPDGSGEGKNAGSGNGGETGNNGTSDESPGDRNENNGDGSNSNSAS